MERRELERQIVEKEWLMFQQVQDNLSYYASQSV